MKRSIRIEGDIAYVPLTKGYSAVIDAADARWVGEWNWCVHEMKRADGTVRAVYALRNDASCTRYLHREILGPSAVGLEVDHIDGDGLNNRRANLRPALRAQNMHNQRRRKDNKSGVKGVSWLRRERLWVAAVYLHGKQKRIGYFSSLDEAAAAVATARARLHGDFARHA